MIALARWISVLGHPFVMVATLVTAAALQFGTAGQAARIIPIVLLLTVVPVAVLMARQVRRGAWTNADASNARERPILFGIGILGLACLVAYFWIAQPKSFVIHGALGTLAMLAVCAVITRWLKVSLHMAFAAMAATTLLLIGSAVGWVLLVSLPVLAWSRLVLARHKPAEVVAGVLIGLAAGFAIYRL